MNKDTSLEDLQTILIRKETLDDEDLEKRRYYDQLTKLHRECTRWLALRNYEKTIEAI